MLKQFMVMDTGYQYEKNIDIKSNRYNFCFNSFIIFLSDTVRRNNGIVHSFLKKEPGYGDKYFARADYRRKYPEAKIIDVM